MKIIIKEGESQPIDCPKCEDKMGYSVSDYVKTHYTRYMNSDGSFSHALYSDYQPIIHKAKSTICQNCATKLPFWIDR